MSHSSDHSRNIKALSLFWALYQVQELQRKVREDHRPDHSHSVFAEDRGVWVIQKGEPHVLRDALRLGKGVF